MKIMFNVINFITDYKCFGSGKISTLCLYTTEVATSLTSSVNLR